MSELKPGFASEEAAAPVDETAEARAREGRTYLAHYGGCTEEEAAKKWEEETLCKRCLHAPVCRVAEGAPDVLAVISRCLAYVPFGG